MAAVKVQTENHSLDFCCVVAAEEAILRECLHFLDVKSLNRTRSVAHHWSSTATSDPLWLPHVRSMWPGVQALVDSSLINDSMMSVCRRRWQLERESQEEDQVEMGPEFADTLQKYRLLAEIWEGECSILSGVLEFELDDDYLSAKVPSGMVPLPVSDANCLSMSLTLVRSADCKYMQLCRNCRVRNVESGYVSFSSPLAAAVSKVCNLGRPLWARSKSEDSIPSCSLLVDGITWKPVGRGADQVGIQSFRNVKIGMINYGPDLNTQEFLSLLEAFGSWL
jgi:hypothetical protein